MYSNYRFFKNKDEFLKYRLTHIGASDVSVIMGISKYMTPLNLWRIKTGRDEGFQGNNATSWGSRLEMLILSSYIEKNSGQEIAYKFEKDYLKYKNSRPKNYKPTTKYYPFIEIEHPELKYLMCHLDLWDSENDINIEAKSGSRYGSIKRNNMDGFDLDDNSEIGIPISYYIQTQTQMLCSNIKETELCALIDTSTEMQYKIKENKRVQEKIIDLTSRFMWYVKNDKEVLPINSDDIKKLFPEVQEKSSYLIGAESEYAIKMIERKDFLSKKVKHYDEEITDINNALSLLIRDNKILYDESGNKICSQVMFNKESVSLTDIKKYPEIYDKLKENNLIKNINVRFVR